MNINFELSNEYRTKGRLPIDPTGRKTTLPNDDSTSFRLLFSRKIKYRYWVFHKPLQSVLDLFCKKYH